MISKLLTLFTNNKFYFFFNELRYCSIVKNLKNKKKINVIFLINHISQWKYDLLFNIYKKNSRYTVKVFFVPIDNYNINYLDEYKFNKNEFKKMGVHLISSYSIKTKNWININKSFLPNIVFFSRSLIKDKSKYTIFNFNKSLKVYVPYSLHTDNNDKLQCATLFHKLLWKQFLPYKLNYDMAKKFYDPTNVVITDYPGCDVFKLKNSSINFWKNKRHKKIIWAPHHTIEYSKKNNFSTFLLFHNDMKKLALKYKNSIDFCFKPHPLLKDKLYNHKEWGVKKTNEYFSFWRNNKNSILSESKYHDLFIQSDALILDSVSFMAEYLYLEKPYCFLTKKNFAYKSSLNIIGKKIFKVIDKVNNIRSLELFINQSVINNIDPNKKNRSNVLRNLNYLNKDNVLASDNIFNYIDNKIKF